MKMVTCRKNWHPYLIQGKETSSQLQKDAIKFFNNIKSFENGRYELKLPFKEETDINISVNISVSKNRFGNVLNNFFKKKPRLMTKYDTLIKEQANL